MTDIRCNDCNAPASRDDLGTTCRECGRGIIHWFDNVPLHVAEHGYNHIIEDELLNALEAAGFEDDSWHNNMCPHFVKPCTFHGRPDGTEVYIWVDAAEIDDREMEGERFLVQAYIDCEPQGEGFETESFDAAMEVVNEVLAAHEAA